MTTRISRHLLTKVLERLGFSEPVVPDLNTLQRLYASWCLNVPFDNVRKMIVLKAEEKRPLPGMDAEEFFENWLKNGSGATCWPMANSFAEFLSSLGYQASRIVGFMRDMGSVNHGSVKVSINGINYLADASLLLNVVFPLDREVFMHNDPVYPLESEPDGTSHLFWMCTPPGNDYFCCRITTDPVDFIAFDNGYEASRERSIFNQRLYARRNYPGKLIILWGNTRFSKTVKGIDRRDLSRDELCQALNQDIGISGNLLHEWIESGSLDESFEPPSGPRSPISDRKPPSQR